MLDISLKQLEVFEAVAQHKSFTVAAEKLYLSQSTVSSHVNLLEQALGEKFDPTVYIAYLEGKCADVYGL